MKLLTILLLISPITHAWVSVGSSPGFGTCTYTDIQTAINSGEYEIRVLNNQDFIENLEIESSVEIRGGYNSCLSAQLNLPGTDNSVIKGTAIIGKAVIEITSESDALPPPFVWLINLTLRDAVDTPFTDGGRGIDIGESSVLLRLTDSLIISNTAENGGGIYINNPGLNASVFLNDSSVFGNSASAQGGGIYCSGGSAEIIVNPGSLIGENQAENGGGIYSSDGCKVDMFAGVDVDFSTDLRGIMGNSATQNGGGIYATNGSDINVYGNMDELDINGTPTEPATIANNSAMQFGGGVFASGDSTVDIEDGLISHNSASSGGGFYILGQAELNISKAEKPSCWSADGYCSQLFGNTAHSGGLLFVENTVQSQIYQSQIFNNRANAGSVLYGSLPGTHVVFANNMIHHNADNSNNYDDAFLFLLTNYSKARLYHNTIVDNPVSVDSAILGVAESSDVELYNSIIHNENKDVISYINGAGITADCLLVNEDGTLSGTGIINMSRPEFADSASFDYRLSNNSSAIDFCDPVYSQVLNIDTDIDAEPRPWDDNTRQDLFGTADAGADETYINDIIFDDGFDG